MLFNNLTFTLFGAPTSLGYTKNLTTFKNDEESLLQLAIHAKLTARF